MNNEGNALVSGRQLLLRLAKLHQCNWEKIRKAVSDRDPDVLGAPDPDPSEYNGWEPITMLDPEYPIAAL